MNPKWVGSCNAGKVKDDKACVALLDNRLNSGMGKILPHKINKDSINPITCHKANLNKWSKVRPYLDSIAAEASQFSLRSSLSQTVREPLF